MTAARYVKLLEHNRYISDADNYRTCLAGTCAGMRTHKYKYQKGTYYYSWYVPGMVPVVIIIS